MSHKKSHIVAKTYLKHFSPNNDGKNLSVLHLNRKYQNPKIEERNTGDSEFWEHKFYYTSQKENPKFIEKFLGLVEDGYNSLISELSSEQPINNPKFKTWIFQWILYSKLRSPSWREYLRFALTHDMDVEFNESELREEHMEFFLNEEILDFFVNYFKECFRYKKWKILINPTDPGFSINYQELKRNPDDYWPNPLLTNLQHETAVYFPLTKKYCLETCPYESGTDPRLNFSNDSIEFELYSLSGAKLINNWTVLTAKNWIVSNSTNAPTAILQTSVRTSP